MKKNNKSANLIKKIQLNSHNETNFYKGKFEQMEVGGLVGEKEVKDGTTSEVADVERPHGGGGEDAEPRDRSFLKATE